MPRYEPDDADSSASGGQRFLMPALSAAAAALLVAGGFVAFGGDDSPQTASSPSSVGSGSDDDTEAEAIDENTEQTNLFVGTALVDIREDAMFPPPGPLARGNTMIAELVATDFWQQVAAEVDWRSDPAELTDRIELFSGAGALYGLTLPTDDQAISERRDQFTLYFEEQVAGLNEVITVRAVDSDPAVSERLATGAATALARMGNELQVVEFDRLQNDLTTQVVETALEVNEFEEEQGPEGMARITAAQTPEDVVLSTLYETLRASATRSEAALAGLASFSPVVANDLFEVLPARRSRELPGPNIDLD